MSGWACEWQEDSHGARRRATEDPQKTFRCGEVDAVSAKQGRFVASSRFSLFCFSGIFSQNLEHVRRVRWTWSSLLRVVPLPDVGQSDNPRCFCTRASTDKNTKVCGILGKLSLCERKLCKPSEITRLGRLPSI